MDPARKDDMELTCPACRARYDVPEAEVPQTGRVVRCSACNAEWIARGAAPRATEDRPPVGQEPAAPSEAGASADLDWRPVAPRPDLAPAPGPVAEPPPAGSPSGAVLPRRVAGSGAGREIPAAERARMEPTGLREPSRAPRSRAELGDRPPSDAMIGSLEEADAPRARRRGGAAFLAGFALVALLALAAVAVYVKRDDIAAAAPALAEPLAAYGDAVDRGRLALDGVAAEMREGF